MWILEHRKFQFYPLWNEDSEGRVPDSGTVGDVVFDHITGVQVEWSIARHRPSDWELFQVFVTGREKEDGEIRKVVVYGEAKIAVDRPEWLQKLIDGCRPQEEATVG